MSNFGRRPVTDAGKAKSHPPHVTYYFDGEERIDRRPLGRVERFVDNQGNVVSLQLAAEGDPQRAMTMEKQRFQYRRDGFVEHAKCPVRHGTHLMAGQIGKDFSTMPKHLHEGCPVDKKTMERRDGDLHATEACPHIEWLIASRRKKEAEQQIKRNSARIALEKQNDDKRELEKLQLEMVKEQVEERKAAKKTGKPKADPT